MTTDDEWERWGQADPYYGVLTNDRFRRANLTEQARAEFMQSGSAHAGHVLAVARRHLDPTFAPSRVLDFGCGVGRVVIPFASLAPEAVGLDVAPSMLAEARRNCDERGVTNVRLLLSDDDLSALDGDFDLVHSCIVFQHIEPTRGTRVFQRLVERLRPGGIGALHVTFAWDAHADSYGQPPPPAPPPMPSRLQRMRANLAGRRGSPVAEEAATAPTDPEMQMYYYNLNELMFVLHEAGVVKVHTEFTDHGGAWGTFLFFQKAPPAAG